MPHIVDPQARSMATNATEPGSKPPLARKAQLNSGRSSAHLPGDWNCRMREGSQPAESLSTFTGRPEAALVRSSGPSSTSLYEGDEGHVVKQGVLCAKWIEERLY
jgi:hypothetical protein